MTILHSVYYQSIKDPRAYLEVYNALRAEPTNTLQVEAVLESLPELDWPHVATLDIGCGGGYFTRKLMERGVRDAACCDIEDTCVAACKITNPGATVIKSSATDLAFDDARFDLVLAIDIIEHLEDDGAMLAEIMRVLKPGGYAVICTQNEISIENVLGHAVCLLRGKEWKGWDPTHVRFYNAASLRRAMSGHGLGEIRFNGTLYLPFYFVGRLIGKPLELIGMKKGARMVERIVSWPVYALNYVLEVFSTRYPLSLVGWGIIAVGRKPARHA